MKECFATAKLKLRNTTTSGSPQRRNMLVVTKEFAAVKQKTYCSEGDTSQD